MLDLTVFCFRYEIFTKGCYKIRVIVCHKYPCCDYWSICMLFIWLGDFSKILNRNCFGEGRV